MSDEQSDLTIDLDAIWAALSRSTQMRRAVEQVAEQVAEQASSIARVVAYDDGYYADSFEAGSDDARSVRRRTNTDPLARRNRRRRGQTGTNRYLDTTVKGDPDGIRYDGPIGVVVNTDFKAVWVEYGSIAKGPRRVLTTAAESVANQLDAELEILYDNTHQANPAELGRRISKGKTGGGA